MDREASQKEREKNHPTFKDNDFLNDGFKIHIGEEAKSKLMETLAADVEFLTKLHIMDYSLLLGVHNCDAEDADEAAGAGNVEEEDEAAGELQLYVRTIKNNKSHTYCLLHLLGYL